MNKLLALGLLTSSIGFTQELPRIVSHAELSEYLEYQTNGAVKGITESYLNFRIDHKKNIATPILPVSNPDLIHSLFETDVYQYIRNEGAKDFLSAKKAYYSRQNFNQRTQQYSREYVYPSDWHSLNHNPIRNINLPSHVYGEHFQPLSAKAIMDSPFVKPDFQRRLDEITNSEMTAGNKMKLLSNGEFSLAEKVRMVKESKKFFHSIVMVQYCDASNSEIINAMISKAKAGVDVRLITEGVWTKLVLKKCLKKLRNGGVKVTLGKGFFNPKTMFTVHHTKFWIRDGEEAIVGGQNMHDVENFSNGFNEHSRDKDVHVTGPAVTDFQKEYIKIWSEQNKKDKSIFQYNKLVEQKMIQERAQGLRGKHLYETWLDKDSPEEISGVCRVLIQGTKITSNPAIIAKAYIEIMKNVKHSMIINTPTFSYKENPKNAYDNSQIIRAIVSAADRGVNVDLITNGVDGGMGEAEHQIRNLENKLRLNGQKTLATVLDGIGNIIKIFTSKSQRKSLLKALSGTEVSSWTYFNHIHSKQMSFDHIYTSTGSFNLDSHSYKNHESTMLCLDKKLADESLRAFISDIVNSTPVI